MKRHGYSTTLEAQARPRTSGELNREDGSARKLILIETGDHFNEVIVPRMKRIIYSPSWKEGKPLLGTVTR